MAKQLFANNVSVTINEFLTVTDTTITVSSTSRFPTISGGDWIMATIVPIGGQGTPEVIKITAISGSNLTVVRGQEGTTAQSFTYGALLELRVTKGSLEWLRDQATIFVDAITAVNTTSMVDGTVLYAKGRAAAGDGGGGVFRYVAGSSQTADGGAVFAPAVGTGRLFRDGWTSSGFFENLSVNDFGAKVDGVTDDASAIQARLNYSSTILFDGTHIVGNTLTMTKASLLKGNGAGSLIKASATFPASPLITLSPSVGNDPKGWILEDFELSNLGAATKGILLDIASAGKYISKLRIRNVISNNAYSSGIFLELLNSFPNADGFFTSVIEDNWSLGGYYLDNIGDSVILQRNTTTGAGRGYYVNELATASHIIIKDGNSTSAGGALLVANGYNVTFENMQVECPSAFTGTNNAAVSANNGTGTLITNLRIVRCNINTQNNPLYCIFLQYTDNAEIDGNTLFCNPSTGQHIVIDTGARNTYIGLNKYFSSVDGTEIDPKITDNGIGTMGIWKAPALTTWTTLNDPANGMPVGFFKNRDGTVSLRGNLTGAASTAGQTLFTLPVGFRPKAKTITTARYANGATNNQALIQILPTGEVQFVAAGATTIYLDDTNFSTR